MLTYDGLVELARIASSKHAKRKTHTSLKNRPTWRKETSCERHQWTMASFPISENNSRPRPRQF
jgi:hypothetical protein